MRLPAMVGLVIEKMRYQQPLVGSYLAVGRAAEPGQILGQPGVVDLRRPARDAGVGLVALGAELGKVLDHPGALLDWRGRLGPVVKARHPLPVAPQNVGQGAVDRVPERAARLPPLRIRKTSGG